MKQSIKLKTTTLLFIPLVLACFALLPRAQAAEQPALLPAPPPDGAYAGFNTAEGLNALKNVNTATGVFNTAIGFNTLTADTTGAHNTAVGGQALLHNNASYNTAVGENALVANTTGSFNMALGQGALAKNLTGSDNTAMGFQALNANTADNNTADGFQALFKNTTGSGNTAVGWQALFSNTTGGSASLGTGSVAIGSDTLSSNVTGERNTAIGTGAMSVGTTGSRNTATGRTALNFNTGDRNTADGHNALFHKTTGNDNTAVGTAALINLMTGNGNIALGSGAGDLLDTGDSNIDIGNEGNAGESNTVRIGTAGIHTATYIAGIFGNTTPGSAVYINSSGQLSTTASSRRFKDEIKPMDKASEAILALKPVTFRYKKEFDPARSPQFGLVAEEVAKVNPDLVARDAKGEIFSVRYEAVNAMLLNEFLKEHQTVKDLKSTVAKQEKQIEALATGLQKVSDQLELRKSAPRTVLNNQ
jgi:trimeric autotransporter adhesin